ncbi:MAG: glycosyltransferase, partial [Defluviitaleaceae bacterium]|nr:glycosyltransferase [Defluviitaleaceae bacterium]
GGGGYPEPHANRKKNILLTVGRIGAEQKNNEELVLAFCNIADKISDWELRLVGSVDERIKPFMAKIFSERPHLRERIILVGLLHDKQELYKEYDRAKIFALTSIFEGGTPNVYAEALFHGCKFITSDIDSADDMTCFGHLGIKYKLGDLAALQAAILQMTAESDESAMAEHIPMALEYGKRYFEWRRNAKKLAYMLHLDGKE